MSRKEFHVLKDVNDLLLFATKQRKLFYEAKVVVYRNSGYNQDELMVLRDAYGFGTDKDLSINYEVHYWDIYNGIEDGPHEFINPWHLESNYLEHPPVSGIWEMTSYGLGGGAGGFIDMGRLYEKLPDDLKEYAENTYTVSLPNWFPIDREHFRKVVGTSNRPFLYPVNDPAPGGFPGQQYVNVSPHPLVQEHPVTGQKVIRTITELPVGDFGQQREIYLDDSDIKGEFTGWLNQELSNPENHMWHEWGHGDVVLIDLFSVCHSVKWLEEKEDGPKRVLQNHLWFEPGAKTFDDDPLGLEWVWEIDYSDKKYMA